ncbi:MAG: hypothetical protein ACKVY0_14445, partial [Prosthecobacter sp.]|uniref:hypothetical protein n=1 Tax=Prosthecobacter sp. TaxID=1965333 RepID=UPI0039037FED
MLPVLVKFTAPVPDEFNVPPLLPMLKSRSVLAAAPVYCSVPPFKTRLADELVAEPIPLPVPPLAR